MTTHNSEPERDEGRGSSRRGRGSERMPSNGYVCSRRVAVLHYHFPQAVAGHLETEHLEELLQPTPDRGC